MCFRPNFLSEVNIAASLPHFASMARSPLPLKRVGVASSIIPRTLSPNTTHPTTSNTTALTTSNNRLDILLSFDSFSLTPENIMDATSALTQGALRRISDGEEVSEPVVQCVQIKPMAPGANGSERYRVVWNDSLNFIQSMITQQANWIVTEGKLKKGSICKLKQFQANMVKERLILVVIDLEVLEEYGEPEKLGQPTALENPKAEGQEETKPQAQPENIGGGNFYGQQQQQQRAQPQQPQQRSLPSRATSGGSHANIFPIEALSPYAHKWTIKARCSHKGDIKTWHNKNGEGKLFSANFLDESGEIRATGFNDAVDQWYDVLVEGNTYYVSAPCRVQLAKKQFSNVNNDYELTFEKDTQIEKAEDDAGVPQVSFNFTTLSDLQSVEKDTTIDCIGVLSEVGEVNEIVSKTTSKPYNKRELTLIDNTGFNVRLTIWGNSAQAFDAQPQSIIAFKGVKVSDFGGRSLSLLSSGSMTVDPDIDEAHKLKGWYDAGGANENFQSHSNAAGAVSGGKNEQYKTIAQVGEENLGMGENADWFSVKATILYVKKDNVAYPACQTESCNKKVVEINPGEWRCEKCDKTWDRPDYRYIMSVNVGDHTGQLWLSCFNECGLQIMGVPANDLMAMREEGETTKEEGLFNDANCKSFIFKCKAKMDTFQDQQRYVAWEPFHGKKAVSYGVQC
jgi:replication factor A1